MICDTFITKVGEETSIGTNVFVYRSGYAKLVLVDGVGYSDDTNKVVAAYYNKEELDRLIAALHKAREEINK